MLGCRPEGRAPMTPLPFESLEYFVEASGGRNDFLRIEHDGRGTLFRATSGFAPDVPEVGAYEARPSAEHVDMLAGLRTATSAPAAKPDPRRPSKRVVVNERGANGRLS